MIRPVFTRPIVNELRYHVDDEGYGVSRAQLTWALIEKTIRGVEPNRVVVLHSKYRDAIDPTLIPPGVRLQYGDYIPEDAAYILEDSVKLADWVS